MCWLCACLHGHVLCHACWLTHQLRDGMRARRYGTDEEVAQALKALPQLGLDRRDLFITSKLFKSLPEGAKTVGSPI